MTNKNTQINKKLSEPRESLEINKKVHEPDPNFKRFYLKRKEDISGVSGVGRVAQGVQYSSGICVLYWTGVTSCTSIWHSYHEMLAVHGHGGATEIEWID